ncbi:MAG: cbb3-type cytochrome oxidase assembly protein [Nitrospirota bacterium]|jgi:cbb3-type cytochrome oxidase maturation protein
MGGEIVFYEFLMALCMGLGALGIFVWSALSGHLDEAEDVKYRILERELDDEDGEGDV